MTVITQNVDNLHEKAGSKNVIHLHGELSKVCSSRDPYDYRYIKELPEDDCEVKPGTEAGDGSLLRPFIVFFGESVPMIEPAAEAVQQADIFVIIGTSLNVYPAAGLISYTKPHIPIYLIDPGAVNTNGYYKIEHIMKGASDGMKELKEILENKNIQNIKVIKANGEASIDTSPFAFITFIFFLSITFCIIQPQMF